MRGRKGRNFLDYIPQKNEKLGWRTDEEGQVVVSIEHRGVFAWIARRLFAKPRISYVTLERFGSFLWCRMNGEKSIYELAMELAGEFGEEAEPLYDRLVPYVRSLYGAGFIRWRKP